MNIPKLSHSILPAFIIGAIEGIIVPLSLFCFLLAKGLPKYDLYLYSGIAVFFISVLLALGAYYTRKDEWETNNRESKTLKIYQALDIDENIKKEMIEDTIHEKKAWEDKWQESGNATGNLTPVNYAASIFSGFITGGIIVLSNNYLMQLPDYAALFIPFVLLACLGFYKYKISNQSPIYGMLLIPLTGIAAALAAYYVGHIF